MLRCTFARIAALFSLCLFAATLHAQFHDPSPNELKMTEDPKARGADGVYLEVREDSDHRLHIDTFYARIKVLTERGKELAVVDTFHDLTHLQAKEEGVFHGLSDPAHLGGYVSEIHARAIHQDGRIVSLSGKPSAVLVAHESSKHNGRTFFVIPGAEVGCILEYIYKIDYDNLDFAAPRWNIQKAYFVRKAHYSFTPLNIAKESSGNIGFNTLLQDEDQRLIRFILLWEVLPPGVAVQKDVVSRYTLDLTDIPALPDDPWTPPLKTLAYQVRFYYTNEFTEPEYWKYQIEKWSKQVDLSAHPNDTLRAEITKLISPKDTSLAIAMKLYDAVQKLRNDDFVPAVQARPGKPSADPAAKSPERTLLDHGGTSQDIATLYLAMLRAAGLTAWDMKVANRDRSLFARFDLDYRQLDDDVVIVSIAGKELFLDPGEKFCPFQQLHWKHSGASGMRQDPNGGSLATTPLLQYTQNSTVRQGDMTVDEHGNLSGAFRFAMDGQEALRWRQAALRMDDTQLKQAFAKELQPEVPNGILVNVAQFAGLDEPGDELIAIVNVTGALESGAPIGSSQKATGLPISFFDANDRMSLSKQESRTLPVDMHYPEVQTDLVTYHLPSAIESAKPPDSHKAVWKSEAVYDRSVTSLPRQITVTQKLTRSFTFVPPGEYEDFRKFYLQVASEEAQPILLH